VVDSEPRRDTAFQGDLWNARGEFPRNMLDVMTRDRNRESHSKDYEFSRLSMEEHFPHGQENSRRSRQDRSRWTIVGRCDIRAHLLRLLQPSAGHLQ
jgi:hypothetical protein